MFSICLIGNAAFNYLYDGYSTLWLIILYIFGGYYGKYILIKKKNFNFKNIIIWILIFLCSTFVSSDFFLLLKKRIFINYLSPTIILQAISLIIIFSQLSIKTKFLIRIISFFTPLTFSVSISHLIAFKENPNFMKKFFQWVRNLNGNLIFFKIYGLGIILYIFFCFLDYIRLLLFKLFKVHKICLILEVKFPLLIDKIRI